MATTILSPSPTADEEIPTATLALPSIAATLALPSIATTGSSSRRLPPPCWSPDETVALIDAYRDKWYSLRRGNLRANHWQEVADDVASRFPAASPKTAVQCRHKMEKLRKRYRSEIHRAAAHGRVRRYTSSWAHFPIMHAMERGPNPSPPSSSSDEEDGDRKHNISGMKRVNDLYNNYNFAGVPESSTNGTASVRIKIPGRVNPGPSMAAQNPNNHIPRFSNIIPNGTSKFSRDVGFNGKVKNDKDSGVGELVAAIHSLGEGFMRMEKVKMDMARKVEEMRMEMELKRTEMILESERKVLEAFAKAITERSGKRAKRNSHET